MRGDIITGQYDYERCRGPSKRLSFIDKEKDKESSLGDFGVRKYDDGIGRFTSIDPLWEKYRSLSPYSYSNNNPLILKDPSGRAFGAEHTQKLTTEASGSMTTSKARSADDPPRGSSHLEEKLKSTVSTVVNGVKSVSEEATDFVVALMRTDYETDLVVDQATLALIPDAISVTGGANAVAGIGSSGNSGFVLLTNGPNGGIHGIGTGGGGLGLDIGFSISITAGYFSGPSSEMTLSTLNGLGENVNFSANALGKVGLTGSRCESNGNAWHFGGISGGVALPTVVGGSIQGTWTQTVEIWNAPDISK